MANPNFDPILSTTLNNYRPTLEDNVFTGRPLVNKLAAKDRVKMKAGGAKIIIPLLTGKNTTAGSYSGYDTLAITAQTGVTAAEFPWAQYAVSIAINGLEEAQNDGEAAIIDLLQAKIEQAEETVKENWDQMFFLDGTGNAGKDWLGLAALVSTTITLGNINPATDTYWQGTVKAVTTVRSDDDWANVYNTASKGNDHPDFGITTQALFEHYEASLAPGLRFSSNDEADGRFQNLLFKGVPLFFDTYCQAGLTYFLNTRYMSLVGHSKNWFRATPFKVAPDKDARYSQIICYGQMVTSNRARLAKISGQTV
jgi:hypothetical protein